MCLLILVVPGVVSAQQRYVKPRFKCLNRTDRKPVSGRKCFIQEESALAVCAIPDCASCRLTASAPLPLRASHIGQCARLWLPQRFDPDGKIVGADPDRR